LTSLVIGESYPRFLVKPPVSGIRIKRMGERGVGGGLMLEVVHGERGEDGDQGRNLEGGGRGGGP